MHVPKKKLVLSILVVTTLALTLMPGVQAVDPETPEAPVATFAGGVITITWDAPQDIGDGSEITEWVLYKDIAPDGETVFQTLSGETFQYVDSSYSPGITYYYKVQYENDAAVPQVSNISAFGMVSIPNVPSKPTNLQSQVQNGNEVYLTWNEPEDDGGNTIEGYNVYRNLDNAGWTLVGDAVTDVFFLDLTTESGNTYKYRVAAVTSVGEGLWSDEISVPVSDEIPGIPTIALLVVSAISIVGLLAFLKRKSALLK